MAVPNITFVQTDQVDCSKIPPTDFSLLTYTEAELDSIVYLLNSTLALMGFSCVMLLVNLYCLVVMAFEKDMRRLEFYLVILQTWSDFFFAGFVAFLFNVYQYIIISNGYCNYQNLVNLLHFYSDSGER
ncbi:uncharacterized protein LOC134845176 isoform X2 [Symsagittifera roscoffensis]|uniref:uncharacterized protein LOC134845176 isoform X2 n=1 Tax=Symsagittifera roscoffensis TaxID=84072 RepID=UPI00307BAEBD